MGTVAYTAGTNGQAVGIYSETTGTNDQTVGTNEQTITFLASVVSMILFFLVINYKFITNGYNQA